VLTPFFAGRKRAKDLPYASSLCGACAEICPVKIDIHHLLLQHRREIVDERLTSPVERLIMKVFAMAMSRPFLYRTVSRVFRSFAPLLSDGSGGMRAPVWSGSRDFPMPAERGFAELWKERYLERP
jgi:L-lactate dehydrogenase complex protein LldF